MEKKKIEDLVGTMDKVFAYEDEDNGIIAFPPGMEKWVRATFPNIRIIDNSKSYWDYAAITPVEHNAQPRNQLQIDFIKFVLEQANKKEKVAGILSPGTGKAQPISTIMPTPYGEKVLKYLKKGDIIFGADGKPTTVSAVFDRGVLDVYKVTFSDGRTAICAKDHLWEVNNHKNYGMHQVISLGDIMEDYKRLVPYGNAAQFEDYEYKYSIPFIYAPVQYETKAIEYDPYLLGLLAGNIDKNIEFSFEEIKITSRNKYISEYIGKTYDIEVIRYPITGNTYFRKRNRLITFDDINLVNNCELNVSSLSRGLFNPIYTRNSEEVRLSLLQGLMDANGHIKDDNDLFPVYYKSKHGTLIDCVRKLIIGFGYIANIDKHNKYKLIIDVPNMFKAKLFKEPKKKAIAYKASSRIDPDRNRWTYNYITKIEYAGQEECRCIQVEAADQLYLTTDCVVTHNTFMACYSAIKVGLRTLIIVPTSGIKQQWIDTLTDMFNVDPSRVKAVNKPSDFINVKADFVVVSQASLSVLNKQYNLEKIMKDNKFGIKVIDEVQMWFHNIIKVDGNSNICHNWYLTGTFGRSGQEENDLYQKMFGDLQIFREKNKKSTIFNPRPGNIYGMKPYMHVKMMWTKSGLSKEEIQSVMGSMRYSERAEKWVRYGISVPAYTNLVIPPDGTMTKHLGHILKTIKMADKEVTYGRMLVLDSTIAATEIIADKLKKMFPNKKIYTYHSKHTKEENDIAKAEADILVSTVKSAGTGFDMKDLSKLVVSAPFCSWILSDQISGRLRRRPDDKDVYMWDIVDAEIKQLRSWANTRADCYKRKCKTFKVVDMD
jgi:hypothetical protein